MTGIVIGIFFIIFGWIWFSIGSKEIGEKTFLDKLRLKLVNEEKLRKYNKVYAKICGSILMLFGIMQLLAVFLISIRVK
jgi:hypothetical protein